MKQRLKPDQKSTSPKHNHKQKLPKKKIIPDRKKTRQLLRSMLSMEEEQRQYQDEWNRFQKRSWAHVSSKLL